MKNSMEKTNNELINELLLHSNYWLDVHSGAEFNNSIKAGSLYALGKSVAYSQAVGLLKGIHLPQLPTEYLLK